ncbi:L,D-transpeptidase family protein [Flavobacterium sp.]|uniref:L,D-transpeptidase family protein n=1 Tax=Flavobacterium sp. TaxID=239 RepID=UPI003BCC9EE1
MGTREDTLKKEKVISLKQFDSTLVVSFYDKYSELLPYKKQALEIYQQQHYNYIWYDGNGIKENAAVIWNKINNLQDDGIKTSVPYVKVFKSKYATKTQSADSEIEIALTSYYLFYVDKVFHGIDITKSKGLGWYLPRNKPTYLNYLDSLLVDAKSTDVNYLIPQYYKLRELLKNYRKIEKKGGWKTIPVTQKFTSLKPGDTSSFIPEIRRRLFIEGDLSNDSKSHFYDEELKLGVLNFKKRTGFKTELVILPKHIAEMNIPISYRIKTIMVNMERCRWISNGLTNSKKFIVINIPSFQLTFFKDKKPVLISNVVVGKMMNETVIFSGMMSNIVFSPYWNVPNSILRKEILPALQKNKNYLSLHQMEWHNGGVRQKPGPKNSLGLIKFLFPNNNNIYLHDTPSKNLFKEETRAFSHGCIRVEKPVELANIILKEDPNWTPKKTYEAMHTNKESWYTLKTKIPVYIGYFTAWIDNKGRLNFYKDIYQKDGRLFEMLAKD